MVGLGQTRAMTDASSSPVLDVTDDGRVRIVRINRPDALNAMNNATFAAIRDALVEAAEAPGVAVEIGRAHV